MKNIEKERSKWPFDYSNYVFNRWGIKDFKNKIADKNKKRRIETRIKNDKNLYLFKQLATNNEIDEIIKTKIEKTLLRV